MTFGNSSHSWSDYIPRGFTLKEVQDAFILKTLERNNWNRTYSAKDLGVSLRTMRNQINNLTEKGYKIEKSK